MKTQATATTGSCGACTSARPNSGGMRGTRLLLSGKPTSHTVHTNCSQLRTADEDLNPPRMQIHVCMCMYNFRFSLKIPVYLKEADCFT